MIEEAYVSPKTAKLLKDKGFNEPCEYFYRFDSNQIYRGTKYTNSEVGDKIYNAPTQQMAVRWLREHYAILISPTHLMNQPLNAGWSADITVYRKELELQRYYDSYEEAVDAAIQYSLENLI